MSTRCCVHAWSRVADEPHFERITHLQRRFLAHHRLTHHTCSADKLHHMLPANPILRQHRLVPREARRLAAAAPAGASVSQHIATDTAATLMRRAGVGVVSRHLYAAKVTAASTTGRPRICGVGGISNAATATAARGDPAGAGGLAVPQVHGRRRHPHQTGGPLHVGAAAGAALARPRRRLLRVLKRRRLAAVTESRGIRRNRRCCLQNAR